MIHTALARKYRPTRFADLVGQPHVAAGLRGAVAHNRVAHAYLLTGPRGVGKTTAARILAMALNCSRRADREGEPCGDCESCSRIWSGLANLDVVEIDAASNRGVDDARDLRERAMYAASAPDRFKVYIVDEAHMLTREAWNALLKILEEPPPSVVFVFATTEPQKIANAAAPVLSRVQRFDFRRISSPVIKERLGEVVGSEGIDAEDDALALIARSADGGMRDALSLLDQVVAFGQGAVTLDQVNETLGLAGDDLYVELIGIVAERRTADVFPFVARVVDAGVDLGGFVHGTGLLLRGLLEVLMGGVPEMSSSLRSALQERSQKFSSGDVLRMIRLLSEAEGVIKNSPNARLYVETLILQWTLLDKTVELQDLIERLGAVEGRRERRTEEGEGSAGRGTASVDLPHSVTPLNRSTSSGRLPISEQSLTLQHLFEVWEKVLQEVGSSSRMLREALVHAKPQQVGEGELVLGVGDGDVHLEGLQRGSTHIAEAIFRVTGSEVKIKFVIQDDGGTASAPAEAARLDEKTDKEERLKAYRAKDKALDAAAEALDLELME